jgi:hypothetical protein
MRVFHRAQDADLRLAFWLVAIMHSGHHMPGLEWLPRLRYIWGSLHHSAAADMLVTSQ